jgi:hypothetical protein
MPDRIGPGGAGIGNDGHGPLKPEGRGQVQGLPLSLILDDAAGLATRYAGLLHCLPVIVLALGHPATGCSEDDVEQGTGLPPRLLPGFIGGHNEQTRCAIKAAVFARGQSCFGHLLGQIDLGCLLDSLTRDIEERDGPESRASRAKAFRIDAPAAAQGGHDTRAGDDDPVR